MRTLRTLFENNRVWAESHKAGDAEFFARQARAQAPPYLWIGCSDSRVPANEIVGLPPGDLFVHRNIANLVAHGDANVLSVLQYGVDVLKVRDVIVCGHTGCGGVQAVLQGQRVGFADRWLRDVEDVMRRHEETLQALGDEPSRWRALCALNAIEQAANVCRTFVVEEAWKRHQPLAVHAWVYGLEDGLLLDLGFCATDRAELKPVYEEAIRGVQRGDWVKRK